MNRNTTIKDLDNICRMYNKAVTTNRRGNLVILDDEYFVGKYTGV